eukprot:Gregarina_sp_Poly_1__3618@NODE_2064_length_2747_cov_196_639552_g1332_i0_p1_GENE_NODE_2064_length_2747_cov_196_639552_g1332_i0NODE_2064_length_2747_cov_196_639552_g1332_i0_p1_ORF_typecomplete_len671_score139_64ANAPC3/PF12895_7/0_00013DUF3856/PF12968_7/0_00024DUF3856/PF12968_7/2_8e02TPR_19/PF14559_6/0_0095TPR_19/PF14559_6/8_2e03TPR_MalT/PF17874_1/0_0037TPR_MalT/PF17874_1/5e03DUF4919/PF16266_5/0_013TPR_1/PF00515_28/18TPR_1/PF00515_28/26TPR_1/PF00515_28/9TPR_16/PF13432_6/1TPR_16/PF13432_6/0_075TPR_1
MTSNCASSQCLEKLPKVETSETAWIFVRSVTGFGYETVSEESKPEAPSNPGVKDALDYSRFEMLVKEVEAEETKKIDHESRLLESLKESTSGGDPKAALDLLIGEADAPSGVKEKPDGKDKDDMSAYFLNKDNIAALGGCAHDRSKERALYSRPTEEKLKMAKRFRLEGNVAFEEKDFQTASVNYQKALLYYDYTFPEGDIQEIDFNENKLSTHLNLAAAKLNLQEYRECISQCYQATKMDSRCLKAYYRKAQAHLALDEFEEVDSVLEQVKEIQESNILDASFKKLLAECQQKRLTHKKRTPQVYKRMFQDIQNPSTKEQTEVVAAENTTKPKNSPTEEKVFHPTPKEETCLYEEVDQKTEAESVAPNEAASGEMLETSAPVAEAVISEVKTAMEISSHITQEEQAVTTSSSVESTSLPVIQLHEEDEVLGSQGEGDGTTRSLPPAEEIRIGSVDRSKDSDSKIESQDGNSEVASREGEDDSKFEQSSHREEISEEGVPTSQESMVGSDEIEQISVGTNKEQRTEELTTTRVPQTFDLSTEEDREAKQAVNRTSEPRKIGPPSFFPLSSNGASRNVPTQSAGWWYDSPSAASDGVPLASLGPSTKGLIGVAFFVGAVATASVSSFIIRLYSQSNDAEDARDKFESLSLYLTPVTAVISGALAYSFIRFL